jgi:hypothetical protein
VIVRIGSWLYLFAWAATLADQLGGVHPLGLVAGLAILGFLLIEFRRQRPAMRLVFSVMVAAGLVSVALSAHPLATFLAAWRRGAAYAAFYFALGTLRDTAENSTIVRRCGAHLAAQPPGRRYLALTAGGHLFSIILSYGAIELFGAMVGRATGLAAAGTIRTRRMLMAAYRGFATMNCWSPLNIMTAVVSAAIPAANLRPLIPAAFAVAIVMLLAGWVLDRSEGGGAEAPATPSGERWTIHLAIVALVLLVMALAEGVAGAAGVVVSTGVTAVVPAVALVWTLGQLRRRGSLIVLLLGRRLGKFFARVPSFRGEATVLGAGGFLGVALGAALPAGGMAPLLTALPAVAVPLAVPPLLLATGLLGLNPIAIVAIIGAAVPDPAALGVAPATLAFACMLGWGVAVGMTPMSASALATARWTGTDPWTVTVRWNVRYTIILLVLASIAIATAHLIVALPR